MQTYGAALKQKAHTVFNYIYSEFIALSSMHKQNCIRFSM